jgi:hypothetical protein
MIHNFNNNIILYNNRVIDYSSISDNPYELLDEISVYLRDYMSEFRNPNFYNYRLDGDGFYILDGGFDMYDGGNFTTPSLKSGVSYTGTSGSITSYPFAVNYTSTATTIVDTDFYYVSLGYTQFNITQDPTYLPLTVLGTRSGIGSPIGWQIGGNSGADGGGLLSSDLIYNGVDINGFIVYAFYRQTYNAGDPSHCNLFILLGHENWDSVFGIINRAAQPVNLGGCGGYLFTSGDNVKNVLSIQTLLSKASGVLVTSGECQTVVQNFVSRIKTALNY